MLRTWVPNERFETTVDQQALYNAPTHVYASDHLPLVFDCVLPPTSGASPLPDSAGPDLAGSGKVALATEEVKANGALGRGPGIAALIWAAVLSVQLRSKLLSVGADGGLVQRMGAVVVTEGLKLAVLAWAVRMALRRGATRQRAVPGQATAVVIVEVAAKSKLVQPPADDVEQLPGTEV